MVAGPPTMIPPAIDAMGVGVTYRLEEAVAWADIIMMLRVQLERQQQCFSPAFVNIPGFSV